MTISITVKGGLFDGEAYSPQRESSKMSRSIARMLSRRGQGRIQELMLTLNGAAAGSAAAASYPQIAAPTGSPVDPGGKAVIETVTQITGNTTAAQKTEIDNDILGYNSQSTPVANADDNPRGYAA